MPDVIPTPFSQRRSDLRRTIVPLATWVAAAVLVVVLLAGRAHRFEYLGLAQALRHEISAPLTGTIETVLVAPFAKVAAGDVVARLNGLENAAALETGMRELDRLRAEVAAARAGLAGGGAQYAALAADLRRFRSEEAQRRLDVIDLRRTADGDEVEVLRLGLDVDRMRRLRAEGIAAQVDLDNAELLHREAQVRLERSRALVDQAEAEARAAIARRRAFETRLGPDVGMNSALAPLEAAVRVQEARVDELLARRRALELRAPVDGEIVQILGRPGQSVTPGQPIAVLVPTTTAEVVAYLDERELGRVAKGTPVRVLRRGAPAHAADSVLAAIGAGVEMEPAQLWRDPRIPQYGLPVSIPVPPALGLTPGEVVVVRFTASR